MPVVKKFGIKYPFENNNLENVYMDMNDSYLDSVRSKVLHVLFTPKGQRLRNPDFGTDIIKYLFDPNVTDTIDSLKNDIASQVARYVPNVEFNDIKAYNDENDDNHVIVVIQYTVTRGNKKDKTTVAVKI